MPEVSIACPQVWDEERGAHGRVLVPDPCSQRQRFGLAENRSCEVAVQPLLKEIDENKVVEMVVGSRTTASTATRLITECGVTYCTYRPSVDRIWRLSRQ